MDEINNLTIAQMRAYFIQLEVLRKRELKEDIIASLAGSRYDNEGLDKLFKNLE